MRECLFRATAALSLGIWLLMATAEIHPPLHAWLHGGSIPDNDDDCAIVAIAHGKVETTTCDAPLVVVPVTWIDVTPPAGFTIFSPAIASLPDGRGPPLLPMAS